MMDIEQVWDQLQRRGELSTEQFGKPSVQLAWSDFVSFTPYFSGQFALFSPYHNYRAGGWWKHLHAIAVDDVVYVHVDYCNPNVSFWLNFPHGIIDVAPYLLWCLLRGKRPFRV